MVLYFVYEKDFWLILVKFVVYKVSLLSSLPNKKQFQLVDLVTGRLTLMIFLLQSVMIFLTTGF